MGMSLGRGGARRQVVPVALPSNQHAAPAFLAVVDEDVIVGDPSVCPQEARHSVFPEWTGPCRACKASRSRRGPGTMSRNADGGEFHVPTRSWEADAAD